MRPISLTITPDAPDADGLAAANSSAGATVTLDGVLTSGGTYTAVDGLGHQISITDAGGNDQSTASYTVTGVDVNGLSAAETLSGPTSLGTVETAIYLREVTSIAIASPVAGSTVDIGTADEITSATIPLNWRADSDPFISVDITGTLNYTIQQTNVDIRDTPFWLDITGLTGQTADASGFATTSTTALRIIFNSYTAGAQANIYLSQAD